MRIAERDRLKDRAQFVILIGPAIEDAQIQVELGQRGDARAARGRAHLSYCSSEKTSLAAQLLAAVQEGQLDHEAQADDLAAHLLHQPW